MASEYSRELGVLVLAGQRRLAELGFKQGGMPGYELRECLFRQTESSPSLLQSRAEGDYAKLVGNNDAIAQRAQPRREAIGGIECGTYGVCVEMIDAAGLGELVSVAVAAQASGCSITLAAPGDFIRRVLHLPT